ncbi:hypothetical protein BDW42DRAFT_161409 [Aspergillus taichungensis]|uniref:Uncharacterized protein n=1 Tax=Aspergillus taichungensis TaxID=482145 RepID=A0A2J5I502_9EURO|nr:hypothetical protein BDW42DRAFT_161409 [Aspergillus taichungensis]
MRDFLPGSSAPSMAIVHERLATTDKRSANAMITRERDTKSYTIMIILVLLLKCPLMWWMKAN